jgi:hypothetical protein
MRELQASNVKLEKSNAELQKAVLQSLLYKPTAPTKSVKSGASRRTEQDDRFNMKVRAFDYYGLFVNRSAPDAKDWTARTMLDDEDSPPRPFGECTLAHIWPKEQEPVASRLASELRLPEGFSADPRNFLVLPRDAHDGFDNEALIFIPTRDGIKVRAWRSEVMIPAGVEAIKK